ncbi:MAG: NUDIX hydrolase [Planctomycetota bacterium]|jgi:8-oxo-dGTP pyrophosphatase MutT (NUDIX family)
MIQPKPLRHAIVAIIEDGDEILMIERAKQDSFPGYWSAVTGGVEPGESPAEACIRECMEEVGLLVQPTQKVWESMTRRMPFVLHWWRCELIGDKMINPDPVEVGGYRWVKIDRAHMMPLMFSDSRFFYREIYPRVALKAHV